MIPDPQNLTVSGSAKVLPRVKMGPNTATYSNADGEFTIQTAQYTTKSRFRREYRLTQRKIAADPLTAINAEMSASIVFSIDEPRVGFSDTELLALVTALLAKVGDGNTPGRMLGGEL